MKDIETENEQLKRYLAEAIDIANFTITPHGLFVKHRLWALKMDLDRFNVAGDNIRLQEVINKTH